MGENNQTSNNPLEETPDDRIERELRNNFHILMSIDQRLDGIANAVEANTANIEILEEAISTLVDIPTRPLNIRFDHRENRLWVNERFYIKFDGKEADIFSLMFYKTSGLPRKSKLQCDDVADDLKDTATGQRMTNKAITQTVKRVEEKLNKRLNTKNILVVKTHEFYFSFK